jgi:hypothetical protein
VQVNIPAALAGGKVSRSARTVNALINTLFLVCQNNKVLLTMRQRHGGIVHEILLRAKPDMVSLS